MVETLQGLLSGVPDQLQVFLLSLFPVVELRGAIPLGAAYGLPWMESFLLAVVGNLVPVPFILWLGRPVFNWVKSFRAFRPLMEKLERKTMKKAEQVQKYAALGLMIFVMIPLPGTGAWTGSLIASFLDMKVRYAIPSIIAGVMIAGFLVSGIAYGFLGFLHGIAMM